jgi:uncharacterized membrane protein YfcA
LPLPDLIETLLAAAAALILGVLKTALDGGIGLTLTPLLSLVMPPSTVLGLLGCQMVLSDPMSIYLYCLAALLRVPRGHSQASAPAGVAVGLGAGIASIVANSGGIILGPYLAGLGLGTAVVVGTGQAVVVCANLLKLMAYGAIGFITWHLALLAVITTPLLYVGTSLGYRLNARIPRRALALALIVIAVAGGLKLLLA